jgi:short-subunit dehydrogenase
VALHVEPITRIANVVLPRMAAGAHGRVVLIGSRVAQGKAGRSQYAATKAALDRARAQLGRRVDRAGRHGQRRLARGHRDGNARRSRAQERVARPAAARPLIRPDEIARWSLPALTRGRRHHRPGHPDLRRLARCRAEREHYMP